MHSRDVIAALEAAGWREVARKGSHKQFRHSLKPGRVIQNEAFPLERCDPSSAKPA